MEWISVEDSYPKDKRLAVLITNGENIGHAYILLDCLGSPKRWKIAAANDYVNLSDVTHWMPLPKPPGGE